MPCNACRFVAICKGNNMHASEYFDVNKKIKELQAENEKLKEKIEQLKQLLKENNNG